jgi:psp operon transcriptional activator
MPTKERLMDNPSSMTHVKAIQVEALGQSEAFLAFSDQLSKVAPVQRPVLIIGERGTGKELAAARLHFLSRRWQSPFVTINCAALVETLIEAELFGHEKGAFTSADQRRPGRFEVAEGGTLFLDEIGNTPLQVQAKILRVVEYGIFERVGGTREVEVDVRIVGATNADLPAMVADGRFKPDLLDRLAFEVLRVPPLRERAGDIDLLADHFAQKMAVELGQPEPPRFQRSARSQMNAYHWPGNIRELKNVVERAVYRADSDRIEAVCLDPFVGLLHRDMPNSPESAPAAHAADVPGGDRTDESSMPPESRSLKSAVSALEIQLLKQALAKTRHNRKQAAKLLGISYDQLRGLVRRHTGAL